MRAAPPRLDEALPSGRVAAGVDLNQANGWGEKSSLKLGKNESVARSDAYGRLVQALPPGQRRPVSMLLLGEQEARRMAGRNNPMLPPDDTCRGAAIRIGSDPDPRLPEILLPSEDRLKTPCGSELTAIYLG